MLVRPAALQDLPAIQSIYAYHVLNGLASFEEEAPPLAEMQRQTWLKAGSRLDESGNIEVIPANQ